VPSNWRIEEPRLTEAKVILQGPQQAFYLLDERSLKLSLDLASVSATKQEFILSKDMVNAPSNLSVTEIKPAKTYIYASRLIAGSFPVQVTTQNSLPKNLSLQRITISPYKIRALYDSRLNPDNIRLQTEPIDLQKITATSTLDTKLVLPAGVYLPDGKPPALWVIIRVKEK
jgi:YbbR domain-containing protein